MLLKLPDAEASVYAQDVNGAKDVEYVIPVDWTGTHEIVSACGWWAGRISIIEVDGARFVEWLQSYSIKFDSDEESMRTWGPA